jgi:hypothetical protein
VLPSHLLHGEHKTDDLSLPGILLHPRPSPQNRLEIMNSKVHSVLEEQEIQKGLEGQRWGGVTRTT